MLGWLRDEAKWDLLIVVVLVVVPCGTRQVIKIHPIAIAFTDQFGNFVYLVGVPGAFAKFNTLLVLAFLVVILPHDAMSQVNRVG